MPPTDSPPALATRTAAPGGAGDAPSPPPNTGVFIGPGLAYEVVSQTSAMVVQDAAQLMRQFSAVTTAALSVITEKIVETEGDPKWVAAFTTVVTNLTSAGTAFTTIGAAAANVLSYFVPGSTPPPLPPKE
jgi:hypothetical protein